MERIYEEGKTFEKITALSKGDYEGCTFVHCDFGNANFADFNFTDCVFDNCNLSLATLSGTTLNTVAFKHCKLAGLHFENCNDYLFSVSFEQCNLHLSSFYKRKLKNTVFTGCNLHEVDFTEADLSGSSFAKCDLPDAVFDNTVLEKADFRSAINYRIDPEQNKIKKAKFSIDQLAGLLTKYNIDIS